MSQECEEKRAEKNKKQKQNHNGQRLPEVRMKVEEDGKITGWQDIVPVGEHVPRPAGQHHSTGVLESSHSNRIKSPKEQ